jgi:hypothetical protein
MTNKKWFGLFLLPLCLAGCASSLITNLTPTQQPRNPTGLYPIEMAWATSQQTLRGQTLKPIVVVGFDTYPMQPTLRANDRWEALVPIPAGTNAISYHFKVDYDYSKMGKVGQGSKTSDEYRLFITE